MLKSHHFVRFFWFLIPFSLFVGIITDGFKDAMETQMFLGAGNNTFLIFMLLAILFWIPGIRHSLRNDTLVTLSWLALILWATLTIHLAEGSKTMPAMMLAMLIALSLYILALRREFVKTSFPNFSSLLEPFAWLITACVALSCAVHLLGTIPARQIFLYVDGFSNIRTFGETALLAWALLAATLLTKSAKYRFVTLVFLLLASTMMFWSGTRAAWVGASGALILTTLLLKSWKPFALVCVVTFTGLVASLAIPVPSHEYGVMRMSLIATEFHSAVDDTIASDTLPTADTSSPNAATQEDRIENIGSIRVALWLWGVDQIRENPIFGHAIMGMLSQERPDRLNFAHLHNFPLDLAYWMGIPAAVLILTALFWGWICLIHTTLKKHPLGAPFLMLTTSLAITSLFAGTFIFPITLLTFVSALSLGPIMLRQMSNPVPPGDA